MTLTIVSCEKCGVYFNPDVRPISDEWWDGFEHQPIVECPVCGSSIHIER